MTPHSCVPEWVALVAGLGLALLAGCTNPMGADLSTPRTVYAQSHDNVLNSDQLSYTTQIVLRRFDQTKEFTKSPGATLKFIHRKAVESGEHDLLFALAELSYHTGEKLRKDRDPTVETQARDYYLASVIYSWLFLFDGPPESLPGQFDDRFILACDLYNFGLAWALTKPPSTQTLATFQRGVRQLPWGEIEIEYHPSEFSKTLAQADHFVVADKFLVKGLSVRNRRSGLGAPLVAVSKANADGKGGTSQPATVLLRVEGGLANIGTHCRAQLEVYSTFETDNFQVGNRTVPLAADTTIPIAYGLNQEWVWGLGRRQFLSGEEEVKSDVYLLRPYKPGAIPVVLVHGTFSSPIWWAEMVNTLSADPVIGKRFQIWHFVYNSGNPVVYSAVKLRESLEAKLQELDPEGKDPALRQMVVIGHSQGGLLTKLTATDTGDSLMRVYNPNGGEQVKFSPEEQALLEKYLQFTALPFVKRVVFISTPHRGSYHIGGFMVKVSSWLVTLPGNLIDRGKEVARVKEKLQLPEELQNSSTSLDGMSPNNPLMLRLADIPIAPGVTGHSIIAVDGDGDIEEGGDGVVRYKSAHVDYVVSEFIVRTSHSCQDKPATIEEVRRILYEHLKSLPAAKTP
ncbi:MAG: alpha/beta hydrolase [Nibricoccus sp.]